MIWLIWVGLFILFCIFLWLLTRETKLDRCCRAINQALRARENRDKNASGNGDGNGA